MTCYMKAEVHVSNLATIECAEYFGLPLPTVGEEDNTAYFTYEQGEIWQAKAISLLVASPPLSLNAIHCMTLRIVDLIIQSKLITFMNDWQKAQLPGDPQWDAFWKECNESLKYYFE